MLFSSVCSTTVWLLGFPGKGTSQILSGLLIGVLVTKRLLLINREQKFPPIYFIYLRPGFDVRPDVGY